MELFFRKYFWTVNLAFLSLAALLTARTANIVIASKIAPAPDVEAMAPAHTDKGPARPPGPPTVTAESVAALFGVTLPPPPEQKLEAEKPKFDPNAPPVRSSLRISLVGTMVSSQGKYSMATIRDDQAQEAGVYMEGDDILGAKVLDIERLKVILMNEGRKEFIALGDATPPPPTVASIAPPSSGDAPAGDDANVQKIDDDHFSLSRDEVDKQLSNMSALATQARIVPSFKDGVANGFKLFSIQPGSIYSKLGIQNGDVIKRINGYEINSPDKALEVYSRLKESSRIEFDIERRGQDSKKVVNIPN